MRDLVKTRKGHVLIDTRYMNYGWESVLFKADGAGNVVDYGRLDTRSYGSLEEAQAGHKEIVERWSKK